MSRVAVVTIAHGRHGHLAAQHRSLARGTAARPLPRRRDGRPGRCSRGRTAEGLTREVVAVGRGPAAACRWPQPATSASAPRSTPAPTLVGLDVDCLAGSASWCRTPAWSRRDPTSGGPVTYRLPAGQAATPSDPADLADWDDPHPARPSPAPGELLESDDPDLFWSLSFGVHPRTWERLGGFCEDYVGYGGEDTDLGRTRVARGSGSAGSAAPAPTTSTTR